jgi:hypothetical protein
MKFVLGFAPWIAWWVLAANDTYLEAALVALGTCVVLMAWDATHGHRPKVLDWASAGWFAVVALLATTAETRTLDDYAAALSNLALAVIILVTIVVGRPFTEEYAREDVSREYWDSPTFKATTRTIAWVWFAALLVGAASSAVPTDHGSTAEAITQWGVPIVAVVLAIKFSAWWPDEYQRRHPLPGAAGGSASAPASA